MTYNMKLYSKENKKNFQIMQATEANHIGRNMYIGAIQYIRQNGITIQDIRDVIGAMEKMIVDNKEKRKNVL